MILNQSSRDPATPVTVRLLLGNDYTYRNTIMLLLLISLLLNYLMNILYLVIFCKYLWKLISKPEQIDYITNSILLFFATLTNYRLGLLAFSHLCSKPHLPVDHPARLTPINYLVATTLVLDIIPLSASVYLIYKETPGTNLFMLGLDLLLMLSLILVVSVWMVAVPKGENYFR